VAHSDARLSRKIKACSGVSRKDFLTTRPSPDVVEPADAAGEEVADCAHARCIWDGVVVWMRHVEAEGARLHRSLSAAITRVLRFLAD
jgi:hypothetical protein